MLKEIIFNNEQGLSKKKALARLYACFAHDAVAGFAFAVALYAVGKRVVVAGPHEYGGGHNAVVVVALYGAHLFAVFF